MKAIYQQAKNKTASIVFFVVIFAAVPVLVEYWFTKATTPEYWFQYTAIEVREEVNFDDDTIDVFSFATFYRPQFIEWNDVLYCSSGDGFEVVDSQTDSKYFTAPTVLPRVDRNEITGEERLIPWRFGVDHNLIVGENCYIESVITAKLRFGIERQQTIKSNEFVIK